ncbi:ankyrin [Aspergillus saccharolyticus JOP 1030-1]|uniref:Ankyrin n=1 Tax=Aspergillus saccharolyticus JOP 1030-1 TaxID=1450539 RepID=A0A318ZHN7_9EURO|nr:ankyrin [Aspergillus saccharolyticus JOP 1030-1]PYH45894.1 ankyrin [Aspergillus saccharolyticus JOP 1030-1]
MDLHKAARQGSTSDIESAVGEGCEVSARDETGKTPLWYAVKGGHSDACRVLLALGARVEEHSLLELAVQEGHAEIVKLLWPHREGMSHHRCLESAISLGFHDIAEFFVQTQVFEFIFVRRWEKLHLHRIFFNYALLLAAKADRNAGIRLLTLLLEGDNPLADVNCTVKIDTDLETPLTGAAEKGNLEILAILVRRHDINLTTCGKYGWPAFLHLLANLDSIASEKGREMAHILFQKSFSDLFLNDTGRANLEPVFQTVLRFGDDILVKRVIDLVLGAAGTCILPLLIRVNETNGLRWILNSDIAHAPKPPPILWALLCDFFHRQKNSEALELFIRVAEFMIGKEIWDGIILVCLKSRNFRFAKQFFYTVEEFLPREVVEDTLEGFAQASRDQSLVKDWTDKGYANAALWSAIRIGRWKNAAFGSLLSCPQIDLDEPFRGRRQSLWAGEAHNLSPSSSGVAAGEKRKFQSGPSETFPRLTLGADTAPDTTPGRALHGYLMQLMLLEQQNQRRRLMARLNPEEVSLGWTLGQSPLVWAAANRKSQLVELLLRTRRVNVNSQDAQRRTPLMHAIALEDRKTVELLLEVEDMDLNLPDDVGRTAVFYAIERGDLHTIQLLTQTRRVNLSICDGKGESVVEFAKKLGRQDVVAALGIRRD